MIDPNKIAYTICHIPSDNENRMNGYEELLNNMHFISMEYMLFNPSEDNSPLHAFPISSVHIKKPNDLEIMKKDFPDVELKIYNHPILMNEFGLYLSEGDVNPTNNIFPRFLGEIGIYLSLCKTFIRFLKTDYDYLIWIEDDAIVHPEFTKHFFKYLENLNFDFDAISLGMPGDQLKHYDKELHDFGNEDFCKVYQIYWTGAVMFSRKGMLKILEDLLANGFKYTLDWYVYNIRSENTNTPRFDTYNIKPDPSRLLFTHFYQAESIIVDTEPISYKQ